MIIFSSRSIGTNYVRTLHGYLRCWQASKEMINTEIHSERMLDKHDKDFVTLQCTRRDERVIRQTEKDWVLGNYSDTAG